MKNIIALSFILLCKVSFCQSPPPPLEATPENTELIIELMFESKFEDYFTEYCSARIDFIGKEKGLTKEKIAEYKKKINFVAFLDYTVFNQFASFSTEELRQMITLCKTLNKNEKFNSVFFSTPGLESNLELQIRQYMKD